MIAPKSLSLSLSSLLLRKMNLLSARTTLNGIVAQNSGNLLLWKQWGFIEIVGIYFEEVGIY